MPGTREERRHYFVRQLKQYLDGPEAALLIGERDYQGTTLHKTLSHARAGETSGSIEAPAGSGKTEVIFGVLNAMYHNRGDSPPPRILVIEPTRRLIRQTRQRLEDRFPDLPAGVYYSEKKDLDQPITFITQDSFYTLVQQGVITPENTDMVLIDEAHRVLSDRRRKVIEKFKPASLILGYTASSEFDELKGVYRVLGKQIHRITDKELVEAKPKQWLCPRANIIAEVKVPQHGNAEPTDAQRKAAYIDAVVSLYKGYRDKETDNEPILGQKGLIYGFDVDHAKDIADRLNHDPFVLSALRKITGNPNIVPATLVKGDMSEKELEKRFNDLKEGKTQILVGDQLFVEGIDIPDASWRMRRAGASKVEAIQTGGRVSRLDENNPAKTGRVFDIYMPSSSVKRPIFYTDVIGTSRLGRVNSDASIFRYDLPEGIETQPLAKNIVLHNSPIEVQHFLKGLRPERKLEKGISYLTASRMAEELDAWPQEVERIYQVLQANYKHTPASEKFVDVGGYPVPRNMIHEIAPSKAHQETRFTLDDAAKSVIADIITPFTIEGGAFLTEQDVLARLNGSRGSHDAMTGFFKDLSSKYATQYLKAQYPLPGESTPATEIMSHGLHVPLDSLAMVQTDGGITLGVHEDVLSRLWHKDVPKKTASDVPMQKYARLIGTEDTNPRFRELWEEIRHRYDTHPFSVVEIDGETIECGYKRAHQRTSFYVDRKHVDWFQSRIGRNLGRKTDDWLIREDFFSALGHGYFLSSHVDLWNKICAEFDNSPTQPVVIDGHTVQCGYAVSGGNVPFCLHKDELDWFETKAMLQYVRKPKAAITKVPESKKEKREEVIASLLGSEEWKRKEEIANLLGISIDHKRLSELWQTMRAQFQENDDASVKIGDHAVQFEQRIFSNGRHFCIHVSELKWLQKQIGLADKKTKGWFTEEQFARSLKLSPDNAEFKKLWKDVKTAYYANPDSPVCIRDHTVQCGERKSQSYQIFCIHSEEMPWFKIELGIPDDKTTEWKSKTEYSTLLKIRHDHVGFNKLWDRIESAYSDNPKNPIIIDGHMVPCGHKKAVAIQPFCVNVSEESWFKEKLGISEGKTTEWKTKTEFAHFLRIAPEKEDFSKLWDLIKDKYDHAPGEPVVIDGHIISCGNKKHSRGLDFAINVSEEAWFKKKLRLDVDDKTSEWKNKTEFSKLIGTHISNEDFLRLWGEIEGKYKTNPSIPILIDDHIVRAANKRYGKHIDFCMHKDEAGWFKEKLWQNKTKTTQWKNQTEFADLFGVARLRTGALELWNRCDREYYADPEKPVVIDDHAVKCDERRNSKGNMIFCLDESERDWFEQKAAELTSAMKQRSLDPDGPNIRNRSGRRRG